MELQPCPFCGKKSLQVQIQPYRPDGTPSQYMSVRCMICEAVGPAGLHFKEDEGREDADLAGEAWNHRHLASIPGDVAVSDGQESRASVFYQGEQCEVVEVDWTTSHGVFSPNTLLGLQNKKGERWSVALAELDFFNLGTFADDHTGKPAESDTPECEGHIYGYGCEWNGPVGWLCDDIDGAFGQEEEFEFCPRCGRDLRPDWAAFRAQREREP